MPNRDARTLYTLCTSQDPAQRQEGFQRLGDCLLPVARKQLNEQYFDLTIVQDCVQEALAVICQQLETERGPQAPGAFLAFAMQVTRHRCIDRYRYERRRTTEALDSEEEDGIQHTTALGIAPSLSPVQQFLNAEMSLELIESIQAHPQLSDNAKSVLLEGFLLDRTDAELAQQLNTSKANIRLIRHRALLTLRADQEFLRKFQDGT
ncbi:MAG: sigma-70 family RNA polymerase sigma factor [Caldilineaceae bacterium]|nr:sigma-70 family RNA polymerase sigma factor [Caldilineaceae bacterium]